jgi:hypothetical protein
MLLTVAKQTLLPNIFVIFGSQSLLDEPILLGLIVLVASKDFDGRNLARFFRVLKILGNALQIARVNLTPSRSLDGATVAAIWRHLAVRDAPKELILDRLLLDIVLI